MSNQISSKFLIFSILIGIIGGIYAFEDASKGSPKVTFDQNTRLSKVLRKLGAEAPLHAIDGIDSNLAQKGQAIVMQGKTTKPDGSSTNLVSIHYVCTDCHNVKQERPEVGKVDPKARLNYAINNDLPFLQGSGLYGVVNRETWYNGDYQKKYGQLAKDARKNLTNAIQLCATECSQGRPLTDWEMKAVLHYLWSIELTMGDLNLSDSAMIGLEKAAAQPGKHQDTIKWLQSHYLTASPATFAEPLPNAKRKYGAGGDPQLGKAIYEQGCRHCHYSGGVSNFTLDHSILTFKKLENHFSQNSDYSIYQVLRHGIQPRPGYRPYMPQYTVERMSRKQVNHLAAYIKQQANPKTN